MTRAIAAAVLALAAACGGGGGGAAVAGARAPAGEPDRSTIRVPGLGAPTTIAFDALGIPTIQAGSQLDAIRALGYATARDRLFQLDLARRRSAGRLAEIFGRAALPLDTRQRRYRVPHAAAAILARLPAAQRAALDAYAAGVNAYLAGAAALPLECDALRYRPEPWRAEDSVLVVLGMFQALSDTEAMERSRTIFRRVLPPAVAAFLLDDVDPFTRALLGSAAPAAPPLPLNDLRALTARAKGGSPASAGARPTPAGSNAWAIAGSRTHDGRAIVANDMHLALGVPNVWYRAQLRYGDVAIDGVVLPGVPIVLVGSNRHVAWGLTNLEADALDLVELELRPGHPDEYKTPAGWRRFDVDNEVIAVAGEAAVTVPVRRTIWGPVTAPLGGRPVAVRWAALEPDAVDLGLLDLAAARSAGEAIAIFNRAGAPPTNAILADHDGHIAWTVAGRIPRRRAFDGSVSVSWADGRAGWTGYIPPAELPRIVDPPAGIVVSANHRMAGALLGHDFANGYRAHRITEQLRDARALREGDQWTLQLDTRAELFERYRALALRALDDAAVAGVPARAAARRALAAWDGRAGVDSVGLPLIARFRRALADPLLGAWLAGARAADPELALDVPDLDTPVLRVVDARPSGVLPPPAKSWDAYVLGAVDRAIAAVPAPDAAWGTVSRVQIAHPLGAAPERKQLNMPDEPLAGCGFCVRMSDDSFAASERMVVSPGRERDALLHMPGGQSGDPRSPHYADQQPAWVAGRPLPLLPGAAVTTLTLAP